MRENAKKARRTGRARKREKIVAYVEPSVLKLAKKAARKAGARSVAAWASALIASEARIIADPKRTGKKATLLALTDRIMRRHPCDPEGEVRKAVREERDSGW